jgi:hypothetical protein
MAKKKPDLVVWDEARGYYARSLTYGSNQGAPVISIDDVSGWRQSKVNDLNSRFKTEYEEILAQAKKLKDEFEWNEFVYTQVIYSFLPIVGNVYHVYEKGDGTFFMSIIEPEAWNQKLVSSTKLESTNKWVKI